MTHSLLLVIIFLPILGSIFISGAHDENRKNSVNVAIFTVLSNVFLILKLFSGIDTHSDNMQALNSYTWPILPRVNVVFGIDMPSLLLILAVHLAILIGIFALKREKSSPKSVLFFAMCFLSSCNAYFSAIDVFSFYTFFVLMIVPLFMQIGIVGGEKKYKIISRFYLYNFIGAFLFLAAIVTIYAVVDRSVEINQISAVKLGDGYGIWVWSAIFLAFVSRIPVWPFHYWITSISNLIKNPLMFIQLNLIPVAGLYGFIRFWPANIPSEIASLAPVFEVFCVVTMLFISFSGFGNTSVKEKLFAYTMVYYLLYLIGVFLPTDILIDNIAYSLFAFILVVATLTISITHIEQESERLLISSNGILCSMPKASLIYSMLILVAIGLPVSALFWNNFIIISEIFNVSLYIGTAVIITLVLASITMLQSLYGLKDNTCAFGLSDKIKDMDTTEFIVCIVVMVILFLSLFKPLWFTYG